MIGLTDGIEVDNVLASLESGASRPVESARQSAFALGDRVRLIDGAGKNTPYFKHRQNGKVVNLTPTRVVVDWGGRGTWATSHLPGSLVHVEPTASVEATGSGEAKPGQFAVGDRVKHIPSGLTGTVFHIEEGVPMWETDHGGRYSSWYGYLAHVEPTASVEATVGGEAKTC